ncbi:hypothetical protein V3C99_005276 [Haemonchus contortus]
MGKRNGEESIADASLNESALVDAPSTAKEEYEHLCSLVNAIAKPLANRKLAKKLYKLKAIRKKEKGIMILAGNVSPIDVYSHIPALCEEHEIPYAFTPSREQLGLAAGHRRPAIVLLVRPNSNYQELYDEVYEAVNALVVE